MINFAQIYNKIGKVAIMTYFLAFARAARLGLKLDELKNM